jgi:hypothetical protein
MRIIAALSITLGLVFSLAPIATNAVSVGATSKTEASVGVDVDANVGVGGKTGTGTTSAGATATTKSDAEATASNDTEADSAADFVVSVTRASVSAGSGGNATVTAPSSVRTQSDLSAYATTVVKTDENVESADLSDEEVSVRYKQRAWLFGVIPMYVTAEARAEADGRVTVRYPWYGFLLSKGERVELESDLNVAVESALGGSASAGADLSANTQARLLEAMRTTMKQNLEASLSANADAGASVK